MSRETPRFKGGYPGPKLVFYCPECAERELGWSQKV